MFDIYKNKKILIFGNTGFVGSNLCMFLQELGAEVTGFSNRNYPHFEKLSLYMKQQYDKIQMFP